MRTLAINRKGEDRVTTFRSDGWAWNFMEWGIHVHSLPHNVTQTKELAYPWNMVISARVIGIDEDDPTETNFGPPPAIPD
jgi:hypothetical protein